MGMGVAIGAIAVDWFLVGAGTIDRHGEEVVH